MWWIVGTVVAVVLVFRLLTRNPERLSARLSAAAERAYQRGDFASAVRLSRDARAVAGTLKEPARSSLQSVMEVQLASYLYRCGRMSEAGELFACAFAKASGARCLATLRPFYVFWADLRADEGELTDAEQYYRIALAADEERGNSGGMVFIFQKLADVLLRQGRRHDAEIVIQRAVALEAEIVHDSERVISWTLPDLHFCREEYEKAAAIYRSKVEHWEKSAARPDSIELGRLQMRLAECEARLGRREQAVELYARAEKTFERDWSESHPKTARARAAKVELLSAAV
jgi:tetratricopeptide (TPR) repeat protein